MEIRSCRNARGAAESAIEPSRPLRPRAPCAELDARWLNARWLNARATQDTPRRTRARIRRVSQAPMAPRSTTRQPLRQPPSQPLRQPPSQPLRQPPSQPLRQPPRQLLRSTGPRSAAEGPCRVRDKRYGTREAQSASEVLSRPRSVNHKGPVRHRARTCADVRCA